MLESETGYLTNLGGKFRQIKGVPIDATELRAEILRTLEASLRGELPATGLGGGKCWTARYFFRRECWHVLDHTWELDDRLV